MKKLCTGLMILGITASASALAQGYVSVSIGSSSLDETDFRVSPGTISTDFDNGTVFNAAYGWKFSGYRAEIEVASFDNDVETHSLNGGASLAGATGEATAMALMGNVYYDFLTGGPFTPYVGAGIGYADVDLKNFGVSAIPDVLNDSDSVLAYQLILGADYTLSGATSLFAQYNYFTTDDLDVTTSAATGAVNTEVEYQSDSFRVGLRYTF